jgi:hypothetical protein
MNKAIIFKNDQGGVSIIHPTAEVLAKYTIEQVAVKDVPTGKAYAIIDKSEIPTDRTFRDAWDIDESLLTHGLGNLTNEFEA